MSETEIRLLDKTCINEEILEKLEDDENWQAVYLLSKYVCMAEEVKIVSEKHKNGFTSSFWSPEEINIKFDKKTTESLMLEYACKYKANRTDLDALQFSIFDIVGRCIILIIYKSDNGKSNLLYAETTLANASMGSIDVSHISTIITNNERLDELDSLEEIVEESKSLPLSWQMKALGL